MIFPFFSVQLPFCQAQVCKFNSVECFAQLHQRACLGDMRLLDVSPSSHAHAGLRSTGGATHLEADGSRSLLR